MAARKPARPSAAELIALRVKGLLERRLAWLAEQAGADLPEAERAWARTRAKGDEAAAEKRLRGRDGTAWARLVALFGLAPAEADLLQVALAVGAEPALGPLIAQAQGSAGRFLPTEPLVKRLCGLPPRPIWQPRSPLAIWGLVRPVRGGPGEPPGLEADPRIVDWMFGAGSLDQSLVLAVAPGEDGPLPREWPIAKSAERLRRARKGGGEARLVVEGRAGSGRTRFGSAVAKALDRPALVVDPALLAQGDWADNFMRVQRYACYAGMALVWREGGPAWPLRIPLAPVQIVCVDAGAPPPERDRTVDIMLALPEPGVASKAAIWRKLAPHLAKAADKIAAMPGLSLRDLEEASRAAPRTAAETGAHLRAMARSRMQGAGRVVDPHYGWKDLILAPDVEAQLRRVAFEARSRAKLLEKPETARLFAGAAGLSALFSGPPGVGKSMAAQVIAGDLGVNLLVVDLAATISKYVGETAKNLSLAFSRAKTAGAALIFEEADAFFARRSDIASSNDRHANADTGHLLQLMEAHDGIVILSTNRRANIDPAFIRRLRHVLEFPRPAFAQRRKLWDLMLVALGVDAKAMAKPLDALAARYELTPAQIKGAALSARYAALAAKRAIAIADLADGAVRELTKEGRSPAPQMQPGARRLRSIAHA